MPTTKAKKSTKKAAKKGAKKAAKKGASKARASKSAIAKPRMSAETKRQLANGRRKLNVQVPKGASFDAIVRELGRRLVIDPGIVGPRGCAPCHSGLDFTVIGAEVINPG